MNRKLLENTSCVVFCDRSIWKVLLTLGFALFCSQIRAENFCVLAGDYLELQAALSYSAQNAEDDLVMLQSGDYDIPPTFEIAYYPFPGEDNNLTIAGGYSEFLGDPCGGIISNDARQTILHGGKLIRLNLPDGTGSVALQTLMLSGVFNPEPYAAIRIYSAPTATGTVRVSNAIFAGNVSVGSSAIVIFNRASVLIENSLFYENATLSGLPTIHIVVNRPDDAFCVGIVHSTFTQNTSASSNVYITSNTCRAILVNDILWGNAGRDLELNGAIASVANVDVGNLSDLGNATTSGVVSQNPLFNSDLSLSDFSPLRDAGLLGGFLFANGNFDAFGNPRIDGANPDIGAVEISDVIFAHAFDW